MDLNPLLLGLIAAGGVITAIAGYGLGAVYYPLLVRTRRGLSGPVGWVLVGGLSILAFVLGLAFLVAPTAGLYGLMWLDNPNVTARDLPFMAILGVHIFPLAWGANLARKRWTAALAEQGLHFDRVATDAKQAKSIERQ